MSPTAKLQTLCAGVVFGALLAMPSGAAQAQQQKTSFDIPAQSLADSLRAVGTTASVNIVFEPSAVRDKRAPVLRGAYSAQEALKRLLDGSGLTIRVTDGGSFVIEAPSTAAGQTKGPTVTATATEIAMLTSGDVADSTAAQTKKSSKDDSGRVEEMIVEESKIKPFSDASVDIPRTINDHQPYYIFDSETIQKSGAYSVEDFLKQRLTMNTVVQTNSQMSGLVTPPLGNVSTINLRGLGADKTLILVNGRRRPVASIGTTDYQPDINGIPLSAIDRIEVLPSSASGIYGGSAIGGVVNIILKKDHTGGEVRALYDNIWDTDSSKRTVSASYGFALQGGKTHLSMNASWSDSKPLLLQDRVSIFMDNMATIRGRTPEFFYASTTPWLGTLPNIAVSGANNTTLILKNGGNPISLNSRNTFIPAGTSASTSPAQLAAGLLANAGKWNLEFPATAQSQTGLLRPFGSTPEVKSISASLRHELTPQLEVFADLSLNESRSQTLHSVFTSAIVRANAPTNPFTTDVQVQVPDATQSPSTSRSRNRSATLGMRAQLPGDWTGMLDYTHSESRLNYLYYSLDGTSANLLSGAINPFVDTLQYPLELQQYFRPTYHTSPNYLYDIALRSSGHLPALPWGKPHLTIGMEHRTSKAPERYFVVDYPITRTSSLLRKYYKKKSVTDSGYLEATVPLIPTAKLPLLYSLDFQLSGRSERYLVNSGAIGEDINYGRTPPTTSYFGTTLNGVPYYSQASYTSKNHTLGLKLQPIEELTLRISQATAFLPPSPDSLIKNPVQSLNPVYISDPRTGQTNVPVYTLGGGNPDLKPQNSKSFNAGVIWEPHWQSAVNLRLNAEYYRTEQFDAFGYLDAQQFIDQESTYPDRIVRDANGTITLVDTSTVNLYHSETAGWDLGADASVKTAAGRFTLNAAQSIILHLRNQYSQTRPEYELTGFPNEGGAAKYKTNATLGWEWRRWAASWTARYFSSYKQYGAAGGPVSVQYADGAVFSTSYINPQGGDTIPSQTYHDLFASYTFDTRTTHSSNRLNSLTTSFLSGLTAQIGIRNVFDKVPPLDVYYSNNFYLSPYGDVRLRSYWLSLTKTF